MSDSRHRILIVEDDPLVLAMLAEGLEMSGYAVATAISGENALVLFETIHPDLVVMDICLPGISGIEAMRQLREKSDLPVIFLTALNQDEATHEADIIEAVGSDDRDCAGTRSRSEKITHNRGKSCHRTAPES